MQFPYIFSVRKQCLVRASLQVVTGLIASGRKSVRWNFLDQPEGEKGGWS